MKINNLSAFTSVILVTSLTHPATAQISFKAADLLGQTPQESTDPTNPDDRFLQPTDPTESPREDEPLFPIPDEEQPTSPSQEGLTFSLDTIMVENSTVFTPEDFAPITTPLEGEMVTLSELQQVADEITQLYIDQGYLNSRAVLPEQDLGDGDATIQVIEGTVSEIQLTGLERFNPNYFTSRLNLGLDTPFNVNDLEDQLRLLQINPLVEDLDVDLQPGETVSDSILLLNIEEANPFFGTAFADNYSAASVGSERLGVNLGYRNLAGIGDVLSATYTRSTTGGSNILDFNYTIPFNPMNGTVRLRTTIDRNEVTLPAFSELGIEGESETYEISVRQPLIRSFTEEFALSLGLRHKTGQTFLFNNIGTPFGLGAEADGTTRTTVLSFGQEYLKRDGKGAWILRSQFNLGLDWLDATQNPDPTPDGEFFSWTGQVQRIHRLAERHLLVVQGDVQLSPDNLLGSESFS
ncbi:MAG: ShlB/FhaC/HecB family hemolysin secretion/activation protein, partial [Kamptonema sp. SIO4C4]|nr:ShlB/FhaC/HecB family hemolysin secretion/activation protein [Kamptonema sp. SIO4C4]